MSLLARLFFVVAVALLPVVLVGVVDGIAHRRETEQQLHAGAMRLASIAGMNEDRMLEVTRRYLGTVAGLEPIETQAPRCGYVLTRLANPFPAFVYLALFNTSGQFVCGSDGAAMLAPDTAARPFFRQAIESGALAIGGFASTPNGGVLQIAMPVGPPGEATGVLVAGFGLAQMASMLPSGVLPALASITVADGDGTIIASLPGGGTVGQRLPEDDLDRIGGSAGVFDGAAAGGSPRLYGYETANGLFIKVGLDRNAAYAGIEAEGRIQIVALNAALALGLFMAWMCGRRFIAKPAERLVAAAERWRQGDWSARTALDDPDSEFGRLSVAFDAMADTVGDRERRLREALIAAASANQAKTDFLSTMNHELRTPLNPILGFAELMLGEIHGPLNARYRAYAQDIKQCGDHLLAVVDDLLNLSRAATGRLDLVEGAADPHAVVAAALRNVEDGAGEADIAFALEGDAGGFALRCDVQKVKQMVTQLLGNAIKFTPPGGRIAVRIGLAAGEFRIAVRDTGAGIAAEHLARVAEPFFRAHDTFIRFDEGAGLGLALVKALIELHGGRLEMQSELGQGTEAALVFPAWRVLREAAAAA